MYRMKISASTLIFVAVMYLSSCSMTTDAQGSDGRCSRRVSRTTTYLESYQTTSSQKYSIKCGLFGWFSCTRYRIVYGRATRPATRTTYATEYECCPGWLDQGGQCVTTTPPTTSGKAGTWPTRSTNDWNSSSPTWPSPTSSNEGTTINSKTEGVVTHATKVTKMVGNMTTGGVDGGAGADGGESLSSLLSNRTMMMSISAVALLVFLSMLISGIVCAVRKICPRKKRTSRLQHQSSVRSTGNGGDQASGAPVNNGEIRGARPKHGRRPKGLRGHTFAASNPSYNMIALEEATTENSYEAIDSTDGQQSQVNGMTALPLPNKPSLHAQGKCAEIKETVLENEYVALDDDTMVPVTPQRPEKPPVLHGPTTGAGDTSSSPQKKVPPKPMPKKPAPKPRKDMYQTKREPNTPSPSATNHLIVPASKKAPYLDMAKAKQQNSDQPGTPSPSTPKRLPNERAKESPVVPRKPCVIKAPSIDVISIPNNTGEGHPSKIARPDSLGGPTDATYDVVIDKSSRLQFPRASDARLASPSDGGYVLPETMTSAITGSCRGDAGDDVPGFSRPTSFLDDSYSPIMSSGSSVPDHARESDNNDYDLVGVVGVETNGGEANNMVISELCYAVPRQTSFEEYPYENQKRMSMSLPQKRKQSLPLPQSDGTDVYDVVEVKDQACATTGRTVKPKTVPRKPAPIPTEAGAQPARPTIGRSTSGPALLRNAPLDSVYVNTARF